MKAFKEVNELAGYTERVSGMIQVFQEVQKGNFQKHVGQAEERFDITRRGIATEG